MRVQIGAPLHSMDVDETTHKRHSPVRLHPSHDVREAMAGQAPVLDRGGLLADTSATFRQDMTLTSSAKRELDEARALKREAAESAELARRNLESTQTKSRRAEAAVELARQKLNEMKSKSSRMGPRQHSEARQALWETPE